MDTVKLAEVHAYLTKKGYVLVRSVDYPDVYAARYRRYAHRNPRRPRIGFPEVAGRVPKRYFERMKAVVEIHEEYEKEEP